MKHKQLFRILLALACMCLIYNQPTATAQNASDADVPFTKATLEALQSIAQGLENGTSITALKQPIQVLQHELMLFVDTCTQQNKRLFNRRVSTLVSLDLMNSAMTDPDTAALAYYMDSVLHPFTHVTNHWFIDSRDTATTIFSVEPYLTDNNENGEEQLHNFNFCLFFDTPQTGQAVIFYPYDAISSPFAQFLTLAVDGVNMKESLSADEEGVIVMPPSDENELALICPIEKILPLMLQYNQVFLSYLSKEGETPEESHKSTILQLEEFQRQYKDWSAKQ